MRWRNLRPLTRQFHVDSTGLDCASENKYDLNCEKVCYKLNVLYSSGIMCNFELTTNRTVAFIKA